MNHAPTHLDLYSGIGGFSLAAEKAGFRTIAHAEPNPDASLILAHHWPHVPNLHDVRTIGLHSALGPIDLLTGGVPCQPASLLGKRLGSADERWLWPDTLRLVRELRPRFAVFENPPALLSLESGRAFAGILGGLAACGYDVLWGILPAAAVGAGHLRKRLCMVAAHTAHPRLQGHPRINAQPSPPPSLRDQPRRHPPAPDLRHRVSVPDWWHEAHTGIPVLSHGIPARLAEAASRCTGNALVPQAFYPILHALHSQI